MTVKMKIHSSETILLLGAGFTKNFGGLLANEMWAEIFNHEKVQAQARIRQKMLECFDYESIYNSVLEDDSFTDDEKTAIRDATKSAYEHIDTILIGELINGGTPQWTLQFQRLLSEFGKTKDSSFIFTLNQDLLIERFYSNNPSRVEHPKLSIPGIEKCSEWFMNFGFPQKKGPDLTKYYKLKQEDFYTLPTADMLKTRQDHLLEEGSYFLIKLHGSYNWNSSDGKSAMVIGSGKVENIQKEPLLAHYFDIFKEVLSQAQRRLLIIGYGFGDEHINKELSRSVKTHGLKIYILSPESPEEMKKKLCDPSKGSEDTKNIWKGVAGYFQCVEDVLLKNSLNKAVKGHFYDVFFGPND